jgi:hypothetical protein
MTGVVTCSSGYHESTGSNGTPKCVKNPLSGGAIFGIVLFVIIVVAALSFGGVMLYLKIKKPMTYAVVKNGIKAKFEKIKKPSTSA